MDRPVGSLIVDSSGFSNYQYPITVPPGIGIGNEPNLSLKFSQGVNANSMVGANWALSGISSIIVMQPTLAIDYLAFPANAPANVEYRYALDGLELLCISGVYGQANSVYKHELDMGQAIIVTLLIDSDGHQSFIVTDQFGTRQEYGTTADSRVIVDTQARTSIVEWKIKRSYDLHRNYIEFGYIQSPDPGSTPPDNGVSYISSIQYTSNDTQQYTGKMQVTFSYSARPDPVIATYWGRLTCITHILSQISMSIESESGSVIAVRAYGLQYQTSITTGDSLLSSITEIGSDGHALASTTFEYSTPKSYSQSDHAWSIFSQTQSDIVDLVGIDNPLTLLPLDLSGRSYTDLACIENSPELDGLTVSPFQATPSINLSDGNTAISWQPQDGNQSNGPLATFDSLATASLMVADFNSDGRADIVVPCQSQGDLAFSIAKSIGSGFAPSIQIPTQQTWTEGSKFYAVDADADGMLDIVQITTSQVGSYQITTYFNVYSASANQPPVNLKSQMWTDSPNTTIIDWTPIQSLKTIGTSLIRTSAEAQTPVVGQTTVTATIYSAVGAPFSQNPYQIVATIPILTYDALQEPYVAVLAVDVNGDGVEDIVVCTYSVSGTPGEWNANFTFQSFLFDGIDNYVMQDKKLLSFPSISQQPQAPKPGSFYVMNLDGSRYPSVVYVYEDAPNNWNAVFGRGSSIGQIQKLSKTQITEASNCPSPNTWKLSPSDVSGVGRGGFVMYAPSTSANTYTVCPIYNVSGLCDYLTATTNPLGLRQEIDYLPMSTISVPNFYDPGVGWSGYQAPEDNTDIPIFGSSTFLVSRVVTKNDTNINALVIGGDAGRTMTYSYGGGRLSRQGRGWKGFASFEELHTDSGVRSVSTYDQDWPTAGRLLRQDISGSSHDDLLSRLEAWPPVCQPQNLANLQLLQSIISTYSTTTVSNDRSAPIYLTNLTKMETVSFDSTGGTNVKQRTLGAEYTYFDGTSNLEIEHTYEADNVENKTVTEVFKKTFLAPKVNGLSILPAARKVTSIAQNLSLSTFEQGDLSLMSFEYDNATGYLARSSVWSSDLNTFCIQSHGFDGFGNEVSITEPSGLVITTDFDPFYHSFATKETYVGSGVNHSIYHAYDPRWGARIATCDAYGSITAQVTDGWGRQVGEWGLSADQSSTTSPFPSSALPQPSCAVLRPEFQSLLLQPKFVAYTVSSYGTQTSELHPDLHYLCRSKTTYNNSQAVRSPSQEFMDAEGRIRRWRSQDNGITPIAWYYREFDAHGVMILDSFPTALDDGIDWVPSPGTCRVIISDGLQRPVVSILPPRQAGDQYTSLESIYSKGGSYKITHLRQSSSLTVDLAAKVVETLQHQYTSYDGELRIAQTINNSGVQQNCSYDSMGNLLSICVSQGETDTDASTETRTYNSLGKISAINNSYQNPTNRPYGIMRAYDSSGCLHTETNAAGETMTYTYDAKGRVLLKLEGNSRNIQYTYDDPDVGIDKLARVDVTDLGSDSASISYTYEYDSRGTIKSETLILTSGAAGSYKTSCLHDLQGNIVQKTLPDESTINYVWTGGSLVSATMRSPGIGEQWDITQAYTDFDAAGRAQTSILSGSGATQSSLVGNTTYNNLGHPLEMKFGISNGATLVDTSIQYDELEQIIKLSESVLNTSTSFTYQDRRLMSSAGINGSYSYVYDTAGRLLNKNGMALTYSSSETGARVQGTINGSNQTYQCSYDAVGRAVSRQMPNGSSMSMTYDASGKMRTLLLNGSDTTSFVSDHLEQTVLKISDQTTEIHCGNDFDITISPDGSRVIRKQLFGNAQRLVASISTVYNSQSGTGVSSLETYVTDHKGTISHIYRGDGTLFRKLTYDDFGSLKEVTDTNGKVVIASGNDVSSTYEAKAQDLPSGLIDFGGRWYDAFIGRFTTPDWNLSPDHILKPDGLNLYAFEGNNPINNIDPSGHESWMFWLGLAIGIVLIVAAVAVTIATGGLAAGSIAAAVAATASGALLGGGVAAVSYSVQHRDTTDPATFWKGFGVTVAIGVAEGAVTGAGGEFLAGAKCLNNIMSISYKSLAIGNRAVPASLQSMSRFLFGVGSKALLNGATSAGAKAATIEAQNAVMGTHQTYTWQELLESAGEAAVSSSFGSGRKAAMSSTPRYQAFKAVIKWELKNGVQNATAGIKQGFNDAKETIGKEVDFAIRSMRSPTLTGEMLHGEMMWRGVKISY